MTPDPPQPRTSSPLSWVAAGGLALLLVLVFHQGSLYRPILDQKMSDLAAVGEVRDLILDRWVEQPDRARLRDGALKGMTRQLDPFSDYISPSELEAFESHTTGKFGGLGIWITIEQGLLTVIAPIEGTPAWEAGILPGDAILKIDGVPTPEFANTSEAVELLKGEPGTEVTLTVLHKGEHQTHDYTMQRAIIQITTVKGTRVLADGIGYTRITAFNAGTVEEFGKALQELLSSKQKVRALILDLRGNPGGYLHAAAEVADDLLAKDALIVTTRSRGGEVEQQIKAEHDRTLNVPMAVLVDGGSASASEILTGALQDNGVATVVGTRSYGKGSVQSLLDILGGKAQLKLTTQYFFTPSGRRIHKGDRSDDDMSWGIVPDIEVAIDPAMRRKISIEESDRDLKRLEAKIGQDVEVPPETLQVEDPQTKAAFEHLEKVLAGTEKLGQKRVITPAPAGGQPVDEATAQASPSPEASPAESPQPGSSPDPEPGSSPGSD